MPPSPDRAAGPRNPYPRGFVFGRGAVDPRARSLAGLKLRRALGALAPVTGNVLELGCGGGQYLRALRRARPDLALFGIDLDPAAAAAARAPGVRVDVGDVARLPYADGAFSAVVGFDILEHVTDPDAVLREVRRVLVPQGVLHLYVPCEGNPGTVYVRRGHRVKAEQGGHVQRFTTEDLLARLRAGGFEILRVRHADYALAQALDHAFFSRLARSPHPERFWAAQSLAPGHGGFGWWLRLARHATSAATWAESIVRRGRRGAMGVHVTTTKGGAPS